MRLLIPILFLFVPGCVSDPVATPPRYEHRTTIHTDWPHTVNAVYDRDTGELIEVVLIPTEPDGNDRMFIEANWPARPVYLQLMNEEWFGMAPEE